MPWGDAATEQTLTSSDGITVDVVDNRWCPGVRAVGSLSSGAATRVHALVGRLGSRHSSPTCGVSIWGGCIGNALLLNNIDEKIDYNAAYAGGQGRGRGDRWPRHQRVAVSGATVRRTVVADQYPAARRLLGVPVPLHVTRESLRLRSAPGGRLGRRREAVNQGDGHVAMVGLCRHWVSGAVGHRRSLPQGASRFPRGEPDRRRGGQGHRAGRSDCDLLRLFRRS
jgi:hypothetical protein